MIRHLAASILVLAALAVADPAHADTFRALSGDRDLGTVSIEAEGGGAEGGGADRRLALRAAFGNTPLGVADGTFEATSRPVRLEGGEVVRQYVALSAFTRTSRTVSVLLAEGRALETVVEPASELTELSDVGLVPEGVVDPADAFARLASAASGCPDALRIYDGRRVVEVATTSQGEEGGTLTCAGAYRVVAGPGHLSPLGITEVALALTYDLSGGAQALTALTMRTGPFELRLVP